jgi:hypothetical protein
LFEHGPLEDQTLDLGSARRWAMPNRHPYHVKFVQRKAILCATPNKLHT